MTSPILLARDGAVATLTLNRPASLNALDAAMMDALVEHTAALAADDTLRCVVIRGAGRAAVCSTSASIIAASSALSDAGRLRVSVATAPSRASRIGLVMA